MKQTFKLFKNGLLQAFRDGMLLALILGPFLFGLFIMIILPIIDGILKSQLSFSIKPWYPLADAMLIALTPTLLAIISAFTILEERDEGIGLYYQITPVEGYSYLLARIGFPMIWALLCSIAAALVFAVSNITLSGIISASIIGTLMGISITMMIVSFAGNRVEGLAISKLSGVSFLGLLSIWFVPAPYKYLGAILPSYWVGELIAWDFRGSGFMAGLLVCLFWICLFTKRFLKRI